MAFIPSKYFLRARLWPTVLTALPVMAVYWYFVRPVLGSHLGEVPYLPVAGDASLVAAIVFLLVLINRFLSKEIFQRWYFKEELEMPTTNYLLWKDGYYTTETKTMIREKIKERFNIELYDWEKEKAAETDARKQICLAVSQIRALLRGNEMLLRHNIEYGFVRNLLGGSVLAVLFSLTGLYLAYFKEVQGGTFWLFLFFTIAYFSVILLGGVFVKKHGGYYAKILYEEFLAHKPQV